MANVNEQAVWVENINLIAEDDPVQGGENGIDNIPHQQLANRTAFLKKEINDTKGQIPEGETVTLASLLQRLKDLEDKPAPTIKSYEVPVGGLFETTVNYADGNAVANAMGYGSWERFGEGMVLVGLSKQTDDPKWTKTIGTTHGEYEHQLTVDEMPSHKHSQNDILNKFGARASDAINTKYDNRSDNGVTPDGADNRSTHDEFFVADVSDEGWADATEQAVGNNQPHNNIQPSVIVGRWRRTA